MTRARWLTAVAVVALVAAGCGSDDDAEQGQAASPSTEPATTSTADVTTSTTEPADEPPDTGTNAGLDGDLRFGDSVRAGRTTVGAAGGSVTIERGSLEGLTIDVPPAAYGGETQFDLTLTSITSDTFGDALMALSPLITVDNGGAYSAEIMTVEVPVRVPEGMFAMGFLYEDGALEGLPLVELASDHVTVATRHFSSFFIAAIEYALLPEDVGTGYRVGEDNWQFVNRGTFPHQNGICAGMSLTSMWYFTERKATEGQLWERWDDDGRRDTPGFWFDDAWALRWATAAQRAYATGNSLFERYSDRVGASESAHRLQYDAFRYAMYVTGEPQVIGLLDAASTAGHAMVVYAHTPGSLWVADPNYPSGLRNIRFDDEAGVFLPYNSGTDAAAIAAGNEIDFTRFAYYAKSALVSWPTLAAQYQQMQAGTVGAGIFPPYDVLVRTQLEDGSYFTERLQSGYLTSLPAITLGIRTTADAGVSLYEGTSATALGTFRAPSQQATFVSVPLGLGANGIGVLLVGGPTSSAPDRWLDFRRFTIHRQDAVTTTLPPTTAPPVTVPPTSAPPQVWDCTGLTGLALLECQLHNEPISEAP